MNSHPDAYFDAGDTIRVGRSASIPGATVKEIIEQDGELHYRLKWTNGNTNVKPVEEMDSKATNKTPR